jgi:hypothetical protein
VYRKRKPQTVTVSPYDFVKAWQTSTSVAEVATKVRSKKNAVRVRAFRYRQKGVPLKEFPAVEYVSDEEYWGELSKYAAELVAGQDDQCESEEEE